MNRFLINCACVAMMLHAIAIPQAEAIEIVGATRATSDLADGVISKVVVVRRGGGAVYHGHVYRGPRGGVYRGGTVYRGGPYRAGHWGGWARPGWYAWPVGGAIAAGAAIGVIGAAAAASWAGPPPGPGLCWYYTDPSQRQGFWDAC